MAKEHIERYQKLVMAHQAGDPIALGKIIDDMQGLFCKAIRRFEQRSVQSAEYQDFLSICRLKVWKAAETFNVEKNANFLTYAMVCVRRGLGDHYAAECGYVAKNKRISTLPTDNFIWEELGITSWGYENNSDAVAMYNDFCVTLKDKLSREGNQVLDLLIEGLSQVAIGRKLEFTSSVLRKHVWTIRNIARTIITNQGGLIAT